MKEFIDKLIERLEEYKDSHLIEHDSEECLHCKENEDDWCDCRNCNICVWDKTRAIVKELAEEYNKDFCTWKFDTTGIVWNCNGCEAYNLPYAMSLRIIADDFECKCPYCGKKIKVVK